MEIAPKILLAKVMHKRIFPKVNKFVYGLYYIAIPISKLNEKKLTDNIAINKPGILSFYEKDHNNIDGSCHKWIRSILHKYNLNIYVDEVILITMPRIFGYVFNPVSFWLCLDKDNNIRAVLSEVNNTFKEHHSYLSYNKDYSIIKSDDILEVDKLFHVSPFLERQGYYKFRFSCINNNLGIWIDYYDKNNQKKLVTSLVGKLRPLTHKSLKYAMLKYPLVTFKVVFFIHWQAIRIIIKGIKYISKPLQIIPKISISRNIKKM